MEKVLVSKKKYEQLKEENKTLKNTQLYKKVLKANNDLNKKIYTRKDIGF